MKISTESLSYAFCQPGQARPGQAGQAVNSLIPCSPPQTNQLTVSKASIQISPGLSLSPLSLVHISPAANSIHTLDQPAHQLHTVEHSGLFFIRYDFMVILEDTARYAGLLRAPAEGFFCPLGKIKRLLYCLGPV